MMIFSLVAMIGLDKCCITSACLQWLCHSGERIVARGPLVFVVVFCGVFVRLKRYFVAVQSLFVLCSLVSSVALVCSAIAYIIVTLLPIECLLII